MLLSKVHTGGLKRTTPTFSGHFEEFPGRSIFSVNIFIKYRIFYVCRDGVEGFFEVYKYHYEWKLFTVLETFHDPSKDVDLLGATSAREETSLVASSRQDLHDF